MVSANAYNQTILALDEYAKFQLSSHPKGEPKLLLKVTNDRAGTRFLKVISQKDLSLFDKILHFFGLGGLTLRRVVNFLQAVDFGKVKLEDKEIRTIEQALHHLDIKIRKYNQHHFFEIQTKGKNLTITVRSLFARFAAAERSKKEHLTLPTPTKLKKARVQEAILSGSVVASSIKDPELQNFAFIVQEIQKAHNRTQPKSSSVERAIIQAIGPNPPSKLAVLNKQEEFLKTLLADDALQQKSPSFVQKEVYKTKFFAHLAACGIPESERATWFSLFQTIMKKKQGITEQYKKEYSALSKEIQSRNLPALSEKALLNRSAIFLKRSMNSQLIPIIQQAAAQLASKKMDLEACIKLVEEKLETPEDIAAKASHFRDTVVLEQIAFFVKWQKNLDTEMSQGFHDTSEALGTGICWALSLRWIKDELRMAGHTDTKAAIQEMKIGKTFGQDRKLQVAYEHVWTGDRRMSELKKVQRSIGIVHRYHALSAYDFVSKENIAETFSDLGKNGRFQREFKGVGQLEIRWDHAAHAICIVARKDLKNPKQSVFRFSEPNFGTYTFPIEGRTPAAVRKAELKLYECLADLITTFYTKNLRGLNVECFAETKQKP